MDTEDTGTVGGLHSDDDLYCRILFFQKARDAHDRAGGAHRGHKMGDPARRVRARF